MRAAFRIGRLFGIELLVDTSWLLIFSLVTWSLTSLLAGWHPDWSIATRIIVAVLAAFAFFASVVFHEMAHALVARGYGIPVRDITLHMFGGVANIEKEPPTARSEFFMAVVGPIASILLGIAFVIVGVMTSSEMLARWLGPINVTIGVFNLIPGFPLDGGRILRAIIWKATGSLEKATRWSTTMGNLVGWMFIVMGAFMAFGYAVPFFGRGLGGGIWLALIGFFLRNAAVQHQAGHALAEELSGVRVSDLMRTRGPWTAAHAPAAALPSMLLENEHRALPVFEGSRFVGLVTADDLRRQARAPNPYASARDVMTPLERLTVTTPDTAVVDALKALGAGHASDLPVMSGGTFIGVLFERDIVRWLELRAGSGRPLRPGRHSHA